MDAIQNALQEVENGLNAIVDTLKNNIAVQAATHLPFVGDVITNIENQLGELERSLGTIAQSVKDQVTTQIQGALPNALDIIQGLLDGLTSLVQQTVQNIATTEDVVTSAIGIIRTHAPELERWAGTLLSGGIGSALIAVLEEIERSDPEGVNQLLDAMMAIHVLPPWLQTTLSGIRGRQAEWQALAVPAIVVAACLGIIQGLMQPSLEWARQSAFDATPTREVPEADIVQGLIKNVITSESAVQRLRNQGYNTDVANIMIHANLERLLPEQVATLLFRGVIPLNRFQVEMSQRGFDTERTQMLLDSQRRLTSEEAIRGAFLRGYMNQEQHDSALEHFGYTPSTAALYRQLYFFIPPVPDLIHMAIRNTFNEEIVKKFQLFSDFPPQFEKAAAQQGVSLEWAQRYWGAHWIVPSNEEGFAMSQRTVDTPLDPDADTFTLSDGTKVHNIIGHKTLNLLLREKDVAPFYRPLLTQLAYRPLTRIDIRRLNKVGLLSKAGVERAYLNLGYSHPNALLLANFTEKLNAATTKDQAASLVDGLRRQALRLYVQGKLDSNDIRLTLGDLGFTTHEQEAFISEAELIAQSEDATALEAGIGKLYVAGFITEVNARARLHKAQVPEVAIERLLGKWKLAIEYRGGTEHIHKHRDLTKAEIVEGYLDGMMDFAHAEQLLLQLGYDNNESKAILHLADFRKARAARTTQIDAIKALYVNGQRDAATASNMLDAVHVQAAQRDAYLTEWTVQRETRTERIPIATLRDMVRREFISAQDALAQLLRHRFSTADASLLLKFWASG